MKKVICENAETCERPCDPFGVKHNIEHEKTIFCRKAKCFQTGKIVKCVEVKTLNEKI